MQTPVNRSDQETRKLPKKNCYRHSGPKRPRETLTSCSVFDTDSRKREEVIAQIAALLVLLPPSHSVDSSVERQQQIAAPVSTFSGLWHVAVVCAFSSTEKSGKGSWLERFNKSKSPLLELKVMLAWDGNKQWVYKALDDCGNLRLHDRKWQILLSLQKAFKAALGTTDLLVDGHDGTPLQVFIDVARGRLSDEDLPTSRIFSGQLDPCGLYGIKNKQIRNILLNAGLARNVMALDSRFMSYVGDRIPFKKNDLSRPDRYLEIEDILRCALIAIQAVRPDLSNLSILDAVIFGFMAHDQPVKGKRSACRPARYHSCRTSHLMGR